MTFDDDINNCLQAVTNGKIILYPTDTVWGIGCDALNSNAIKKIYQLKKREEKKSMIILLASENDISKYVLHPSKKIIDYILLQKKPTTAVFNEAINLPETLINIDGSIAIRVVKDNFCEAIIKKLNKPLVSTSANISGEKTPANFAQISDEIKNGAGYIAEHRRYENEIRKPSSIIKLINNEIEILR